MCPESVVAFLGVPFEYPWFLSIMKTCSFILSFAGTALYSLVFLRFPQFLEKTVIPSFILATKS